MKKRNKKKKLIAKELIKEENLPRNSFPDWELICKRKTREAK